MERDTVREVTVVTVRVNEAGDTLRRDVVTDREKVRDANRFRGQDSRVMVKTDTVYVERRDSVSKVTQIPQIPQKVKGGGNALHTTLRWIFYIILALMGLVVTVKVCLRKA